MQPAGAGRGHKRRTGDVQVKGGDLPTLKLPETHRRRTREAQGRISGDF